MQHKSLLAELRLVQLLSELGRDCPPLTVETKVNGMKATLRVSNGEEMNGGEPLSFKERQILDAVRLAVRAAGRRLSGAEIRAACHVAGLKWSATTINQTLADLVANGHLVNDRDKRGYGLPDHTGQSQPETNQEN